MGLITNVFLGAGLVAMNVAKASKDPVCILGAGAAGTLAAHRVMQRGQSVVLFEKEAEIGGNCHWLHTDGIDIPLGVQLFPGTEHVLSILDEFDVEHTPFDWSALSKIGNYDFSTGEETVSHTIPWIDIRASGARLYALFAKEPWLVDPQVEYPAVIPAYLMTPYSEFQVEHGLEGFHDIYRALGTGYDVATMPAWMALRLLTPVVTDMLTTSGISLTGTCEAIYERMDVLFGDSLKKSTNVIHVDRPAYNSGSTSIDHATIIYSTDGGPKQKQKCSSVVVAYRPSTESMAIFDTDSYEDSMYKRMKPFYFGVMAYKFPGDRAAGYFYNNVPSEVNPFGYPPFPGTYSVAIDAEKDGMVYAHALIASDHAMSEEKMIDIMSEDVARLPGVHGPIEVLEGHLHHFGYRPVDVNDQSFYGDMEAAQGRRLTYFTGAAMSYESHFDAWAHADRLVPTIPYRQKKKINT